MLIAYYLGNRKRKYVKEKTTTTLKSKETSIATVRYHLQTLASFTTLLVFHWSLPLKGLSHEIDFKNVDENGQILALTRASAEFLIFQRLL